MLRHLSYVMLRHLSYVTLRYLSCGTLLQVFFGQSNFYKFYNSFFECIAGISPFWFLMPLLTENIGLFHFFPEILIRKSTRPNSVHADQPDWLTHPANISVTIT